MYSSLQSVRLLVHTHEATLQQLRVRGLSLLMIIQLAGFFPLGLLLCAGPHEIHDISARADLAEKMN